MSEPQILICPFTKERCKENRCAIYGNGNCSLLSIAYSLREMKYK